MKKLRLSIITLFIALFVGINSVSAITFDSLDELGAFLDEYYNETAGTAYVIGKDVFTDRYQQDVRDYISAGTYLSESVKAGLEVHYIWFDTTGAWKERVVAAEAGVNGITFPLTINRIDTIKTDDIEALLEAKELALEALDDALAGYNEAYYTGENWDLLETAYRSGVEAINAATTEQEVEDALNDALEAMAAVTPESREVDVNDIISGAITSITEFDLNGTDLVYTIAQADKNTAIRNITGSEIVEAFLAILGEEGVESLTIQTATGTPFIFNAGDDRAAIFAQYRAFLEEYLGEDLATATMEDLVGLNFTVEVTMSTGYVEGTSDLAYTVYVELEV